MARTLTAADRTRLIKMASTMPVGSPERKAILKGLSKSAGKAGDFKAGDLVRHTGKFLRNTGMAVGAPVDGKVVEVKSEGYFAGHPVVQWSDGGEPSLIRAENIQHARRRASGRMAGFQSKGLKKTKVASDSPILMPVRGGDELVMPANGTDFKLREVQKMIGGYVEVVYLRDGRIMLVDEEGLLKGLPLNRAASRMAGRPIVGNALVMPNDMFR